MRKRLICDSWSNFIRHIKIYPFSRGAPCAPTFFLLCWVEFNKNCPTDWLQKSTMYLNGGPIIDPSPGTGAALWKRRALVLFRSSVCVCTTWSEAGLPKRQGESGRRNRRAESRSPRVPEEAKHQKKQSHPNRRWLSATSTMWLLPPPGASFGSSSDGGVVSGRWCTGKWQSSQSAT